MLDTVNGILTVSGIGNTEPLACRVENLNGGCALVDKLVDHKRDEELGLEILHGLRIGKELLEICLTMFEIVGSEAPHVHRHWRVVFHGHPLAFLVLVTDRTVDTHYLRALHNGGEVALLVL